MHQPAPGLSATYYYYHMQRANAPKFLIFSLSWQQAGKTGKTPLVLPTESRFKGPQYSGDDQMTTWITICDTCKGEDWDVATHSRPHGEDMANLVESHAKGRSVKTRRVSCLMGCSHGCNVAIQAEDKLAYTLGRFTPDADSAAAIVDYAELHAESANGQVPFRQWPQGVKGHFITRHPPLPKTEG